LEARKAARWTGWLRKNLLRFRAGRLTWAADGLGCSNLTAGPTRAPLFGLIARRNSSVCGQIRTAADKDYAVVWVPQRQGIKSRRPESNRRPPLYESGALAI
jgi:hypothetical protein